MIRKANFEFKILPTYSVMLIEIESMHSSDVLIMMHVCACAFGEGEKERERNFGDCF